MSELTDVYLQDRNELGSTSIKCLISTITDDRFEQPKTFEFLVLDFIKRLKILEKKQNP